MSEHKMIVIDLPWPPRGLSPNARTSRYPLAELKRTVKQETMVLARRAYLLNGESKHAPFTGDSRVLAMAFYPPDKRRRDLDNLHASMKAQIDSIADVLGVDDRVFAPQVVDWGDVVKRGCVRVVIGGTMADALRLARGETEA